MSAIKKNLIGKDHADKSWLLEDYESHWSQDDKPIKPRVYIFSICALTMLVIATIKGW